jgi:putative membrane protein
LQLVISVAFAAEKSFYLYDAKSLLYTYYKVDFVTKGEGGNDDDDEGNDEQGGKAPTKGNDVDRTTQFLANDRTFLAWLRTCIAIIGLGFVVARFSLFLREFGLLSMTKEGGSHIPQAVLATSSPSSSLGLGMVGLGIALTIYAFYNYRNAHHTIEVGKPYTPKHSIMYIASIGLVAFGIIVIVYLLAISI